VCSRTGGRRVFFHPDYMCAIGPIQAINVYPRSRRPGFEKRRGNDTAQILLATSVFCHFESSFRFAVRFAEAKDIGTRQVFTVHFQWLNDETPYGISFHCRVFSSSSEVFHEYVRFPADRTSIEWYARLHRQARMRGREDAWGPSAAG